MRLTLAVGHHVQVAAALRFWCVFGEAALRSDIGGLRVMCEQLAHLIHVNRSMENVVMHVLPLASGPHAFTSMTATLYGFPPPATSVLVIGSDAGNFTDPDGFVWEAASR
ncbi:hypothetical protein SAMN06265360_10720 [Haloechinothrix alba]|uniref:DUF5753 domain-containing protein n=1 Tax=Haloechinothrix alba TaxID=664784 RepID=A0A238WNY1_9PSEU|nr:Scr1 family TA system antitoxin-like transcriptional regulator [Haloechinothrix alba]SNR48033.1 hypothetical protein SAMN06265360_10720 [Haloechinothrix alba]